MKRILLLLMALLVLGVPVAAAELPAESTGTESISEEITQPVADVPSVDATATKDEEGVTVNVTIAQPETAAVSSAESDTASSAEAAVSSAEDSPLVRAFSTSSPDLLAAGAPDGSASTMADVVTAVFGEYQRRTYTVNHYDSGGNVIATSTEFVPGLAGLDYSWISGVSLFALVLSGFLRLIGGLLRR